MKNVVLLFGGASTEHDISRRSILTFIDHMDRTLYNPILVGITKEGRWLLFNGDKEAIIDGTWHEQGIPAIISPDAKDRSLLIMRGEEAIQIQIDCVIPVLHGTNGEDGTVQGLLKMSRIPFVGCGVLASAVAMDKSYTKLIVEPLGIRQAKWVLVMKETYNPEVIAVQVAEQLTYPVFVKPSNTGSSIGVSKAHDESELDKAVREAFRFDRKVLIEEGIIGREVECAVMGNLEVEASDVGEILSADEFYDYNSKYNNPASETVVSADIPEEARAYVKECAIRIFKAIDGRGLARVDFFIEEATGEVVFNEINTMPGFTSISLYPLMMQHTGKSFTEQITSFIRLAEEEAMRSNE